MMFAWAISNEWHILPPFLEERFQWVNTSIATGVSWPHTTNQDVSGFTFMLTKPFEFISLICKRFLFLTGITPDVLYVRPNTSKAIEFLTSKYLYKYDYIVELTCTFIFLLGLLIHLLDLAKRKCIENKDIITFSLLGGS